MIKNENEVETDDIVPQNKEATLKLVNEVKTELKDYRKQFEAEWKQYDDAYYGKQHLTSESRKTVKNHIFKIIEGSVPILTDSQPSTQILAQRADRQDDADSLNNALKYVYQDQNLQLILPTLVRSSLISAPGYLYVSFNPDAEDGQGKIEFKQLSWRNVFLDGNAQTIEQAEKVRIEIPMRRDAVARKWPEKKEEILKVSGKKQEFNNDDNYESRDISNGREMPSTGKPKDFSAKDVAIYAETWVQDYGLKNIDKDDTAEELQEQYEQIANGEAPDISKWQDHKAHIQAHTEQKAAILAQLNLPPEAASDDASKIIDQLIQQSPEAQDQLSKALLSIKIAENHISEHEEYSKLNPTGQEPRYEDGWRLIKTFGDVVLYDGGNPNEDGLIPLVPFYCYKDDTIYGFGEVKNILDSQRSLNTVDYYEYMGLKVATNPGWVADKEADLNADALTNEPGIVVIKKRGSEVRRLEPGQVSPQLEQRKQTDQLAMENISGIGEATQGNLPASASGIAITKLQNQAIGRVRLKDRYLQSYSIRRLGIITTSFIINNWTSEKYMRLRTDVSNAEEFIFDPVKVQDLEYSIDIAPGSMAGIDKDALNALFLNLYQVSQGQMTFEDLLVVSDFPKKEVILSRLKDRQQQNDQQQQQVQQMQQQFQDQMAQMQQQIQQLADQNIKLKGSIGKELLNNEEKKAFDANKRQDVVNQITGNMPNPADQNAMMQNMGPMPATNGQG